MTTCLVIPGLGGSGPTHWQSHWARALPQVRRVVQDDWDAPQRKAWVATLAAAVDSCRDDVVLIAHSLGCALVAHWARQHGGRVRGALLVAPADVDSPAHTPAEVRGFAPMPLRPLPFASIVVASRNDPYVPMARARQFADCWGSRFEDIGDAGHINADAGLGNWPDGLALLDTLCAAALTD
ncbi:RBBP9/YdeN family alpha/beta hydrolase [Denitromonas iodatirespirans]|uniref:Alpha/beta hydrolase n=1 Tax=Denitromonas iodatirespirans TaxID=2795389 RepID=A0A944DA29_DENI1|nr:alpha/beta hydrolase [Denitromonas iodatirespirans]MBT0961206.1 alpha/beta hydrolase [Denitromonas iodatirespirans]